MSLNPTSPVAQGVRDRVTEAVAGCLGLAPAEIDPREPLALYGLDSLRSVELGVELEDAFRRPLPDELLIDHPSVDALVRRLESGEQPARTREDDRAMDPMRADDRAIDLMRNDGVLPPDIRPEAAPAQSRERLPPGPCRSGRRPGAASAPSRERVLLTGATGFLGAHLLRTLLTETGAEVLCLVRTGDADAVRVDDADVASRRVRRSLERYRLWDDAFGRRIRTVTGDLSQPGLGLAGGARAAIASTVDTVYHAAADVNWISPYGALRAANVVATRELLRLACRGRPKAFHFVSSLSVCHAVGGPRLVAEDDDLFGRLEGLPLGYAQSKCVAEALVRQARARGLRASIHRPALLTGDSASGVSKHDDLVSSLFQGCIRMGTAPDLDWRIDAVPVDQAARAIVHLSATAPQPAHRRLTAPPGARPTLQESAPFHRADSHGVATFHESARQARRWRECVLWMNLYGYPVRLAPYDRWAEQLARDAARPDHPLHRLRGFFLRRRPDGTAVPELYQEARSSAPRSTRTQALLAEAGLDFHRLDAGLLGRYFDEYVAAGFLPPPRRGPRPAANRPVAHRTAANRTATNPLSAKRPAANRPVANRPASSRPAANPPAPPADPDRARFEPMLRRYFGDDSLAVTGATRCAHGAEHSVIAELGGWRGRGRTGLSRYRLDVAGRGGVRPLDVVTKVKPADRELIEVAEAMADTCDAGLGRAVRRFRERIGLRGAHLRELALYAEPDERLRRHTPVCYGTWRDDARREWGLVLERLDGDVLLDATDDPTVWTPDRVGAAVDGLAEIHAVWLGREDDLRNRSWIGHVATSRSMVEMTPLWRALADHAAPRLAEWAGPALVRTHRALVDSLGTWWPHLETAARTLIHNDFSPRNAAIRGAGASARLCAYDWELATVGAPQCDLAHFLCFVLDPGVRRREAARYVERHRAALAAAAGARLDPCAWRAGFGAALADLLVNRLMFYVMIDRVRPLRFLPRIVRTWQRLHDLFGAWPPVVEDSAAFDPRCAGPGATPGPAADRREGNGS